MSYNRFTYDVAKLRLVTKFHVLVSKCIKNSTSFRVILGETENRNQQKSLVCFVYNITVMLLTLL